jgi:hypothetical protein
MILYGKPGYLHSIQKSDSLSLQPRWSPWQQVTPTDLFTPIEAPVVRL